MRKVFISQPMKGKSAEEIDRERKNAIKYVKMVYGKEIEVLDSYFKDFNGNAVEFLGKSIMLLGQADLAVFLSGWEEARGCRVEEAVAHAYGIKRAFPVS